MKELWKSGIWFLMLALQFSIGAERESIAPNSASSIDAHRTDIRFRLLLSSDQLARLSQNLLKRQESPQEKLLAGGSWNEMIPATLQVGEESFTVSVRHFGPRHSRTASRRSYYIEFPPDRRWRGHPSIALTDAGEEAEAAAALFRLAGLPAPVFIPVTFQQNQEPPIPRRLQLLTSELRDGTSGATFFWDDDVAPTANSSSRPSSDWVQSLEHERWDTGTNSTTQSIEARRALLGSQLNIRTSLRALVLTELLGGSDAAGLSLSLHRGADGLWTLLPDGAAGFFSSGKLPDLPPSSKLRSPAGTNSLVDRIRGALFATYDKEHAELQRALLSELFPSDPSSRITLAATVQDYLRSRVTRFREELGPDAAMTSVKPDPGAAFIRANPAGERYLSFESNQPPKVSVVLPHANEVVASGTRVVVKAKAMDLDGIVARVELWDGAQLLDEGSLGILEHVWLDASVGLHQLHAVATDDQGARSTSGPVRLHVVPQLTQRELLISSRSAYRSVEGALPMARTWVGAAYDDRAWRFLPAIPEISLPSKPQVQTQESVVASTPSVGSSTNAKRFSRHAFQLEAPRSIRRLTLELAGPPPIRLFLNGVPLELPSAAEADIAKSSLSIDPERLIAGTNLLAAVQLASTPEEGPLSFRWRLEAERAVLAPAILESPHEATARAGDTVLLTAMIGGTPPFQYQWRKDGRIIPDATNAVIQLNDLRLAHSGLYSVVAKNVSGEIQSESAALVVSQLVETDADGDGIPDAWEVENHLDPRDPSDAITDADGDGQSNRNEYFCGTDPQDPLDVLHLQIINTVTGLRLKLEAASNKGYTVQYRDPVEGGAWMKFLDVPSHLVRRSVDLCDNDASPARVYRLITPPIP